jgi:hypothetical protein
MVMARTGKAACASTATTLSSLKQQFDQWRAARHVGERIPPQLWDAAVNATAEHGAYRVSRALNLDYVVLKRRAARMGASAGVPGPRFVEWVAPQGLPLPAPGSDAQCVVEMANAHGATMRLQLRGGALAGLPALCQAFWSA